MHMSRYLIYQWNRERGRMALAVFGWSLDEPMRASWEQVLRQRYRELIHHLDSAPSGRAMVQFDGDGGEPTAFLVRYADANRTVRNPAMILVPHTGPPDDLRETPPAQPNRGRSGQRALAKMSAAAEAAKPPEQRLPAQRLPSRGWNSRPWIAGLLSDLETTLTEFAGRSPERLSKMDRAALGFVLGEFRTLSRVRPDHVAIAILAGYVSLCQKNETDSEEAALYALAARGLNRLSAVEPGLAQRATGANARGDQPTESGFRRISRMLARLLGLDDFQ
jgi:hypothetical protein